MGASRVVGVFVVMAACGALMVAQEHGLTDGVYSDTQATRGGRVFRQACASCHGRNLEGGEMGPGLKGGPFITSWEGNSLAELMAYVQETMPQGNPGGLDEQGYSDVLAYLLKLNEFPSGDVDLSTESAEDIIIEPSR